MHRRCGHVGLARACQLSLLPLSLLSLAGCQTDSGDTGLMAGNSPAAVTNVGQARSVLKAQLERSPLAKNVVFHNDPGDIRHVTYTEPANDREFVVQLTTLLPNSIAVTQSPGSNVTYEAWKVSYTEYVQMHEYHWLTSSWSKSDAEQVAQALKILVRDARDELERNSAAGFEKFKTTCQSWKSKKEPMPEAARQHKEDAEKAFRDKDLDKAGLAYIDALQVYPCWPEGQFNAAAILGETGWYGGAVNRMKNYLYLVPDARDAEAAKKKLALWQNKMGD